MKISVAIATFNRASMVKQAVEAALAQSPTPFEVVVSDDASTDDTRALFEQWAAADPRVAAQVKVLHQPVNSKGVGNWNHAMEATTGDLIAWCSDDDRFLPGHLQESAAYLAAHPEIGLVHSGFVDLLETAAGRFEEARPLRSLEPLIIDRAALLGYLIRYYDWPFHPSTIVMRRAVWEQIGPFNPHYALADTDWFVRAVQQFPAALLPRHGVLNRRHSGNWSNRVGSARMQCEIYEIVDQAIARLWFQAPLRRVFWHVVWSFNVRARLALTIRARVRAGHTVAAIVAWQSLARYAGKALPGWIEKTGEALIRHWPQVRAGAKSWRETVSPP